MYFSSEPGNNFNFDQWSSAITQVSEKMKILTGIPASAAAGQGMNHRIISVKSVRLLKTMVTMLVRFFISNELYYSSSFFSLSLSCC